MNRGIPISRCVNCGAEHFPPNMLCSRCSGSDFEVVRVFEAVVEEFTTVRHMLGQENWQPRRIASVRTSGGVLLTVGLHDESGPGTTIELFEEDSAPFGRAK
jgi:uncharacterized OB-fold protein